MLTDLLPGGVFAILLIFVRIGTALLLLPGIGEAYVTPRIRLLIALLLAVLLAPIVGGGLPGLPASFALMTLLILGESVIGLFIGALARLFIAALATAGMMIAYSSALANALVNDPSAAQQGSIPGSFLTLIALTGIFALDLHHLMLRALVESYQVFVPGQPLPMGDLSDTVARTVARTFALSFQVAAPFIATSLILYLGVGLLARLMPQVQIFFVAMPVQILLGLLVLALVVPFAMRWFMGDFQSMLLGLAGRGGGL